MARDVNLVWNYCNDLGLQILRRENRFASAFELQRYLNGASKEGLLVGSVVFQQVAEEFAVRRRQFRKPKLRWRGSDRNRNSYSLGWIPFKARALAYRNGQVCFQGLKLSLWDSYGLGEYELGAGNICEDARGRWYLNVTVRVKPVEHRTASEKVDAVGIDLGLKDMMVASDGTSVEAQRFYRDLEPALAVAQRAGKKQRVKSIHAKIANRRKDHLHKLSTSLVRKHQAIFVGDVNAQALAQTPLAKSVLDAGWSAFRTMLRYKCDGAGVWFAEVDEKFSTQECSSCQALTGPKGRAGLAVRSWTCPVCGTNHHRDINAALSIRTRGLAWLEKQFSATGEARAGEAVVNERGPSGLSAAGHGRPEVGISVT